MPRVATDDDFRGLAIEMAGLRGAMNEGFARIEGRLDLIASSQDRFQRDLDDLDGALADVEKRVKALEDRRWPVGQMAAVSGVVGTVAAVAAVFVR